MSQLDDAIGAMRAAQRLALISHRDPDADTIGAALALGLALEGMGKRITWHCADAVPESLGFLSGSERYVQTAPAADVDLVVTVDFGDLARAKFDLPNGVPVLNIDHHATNVLFGTHNYVDATSAASGEVVSRLIDALGVAWTADMATAALVAIMTDTGSFQFPNTDERALARAGRLRSLGADLQAITYNIYRSKRFEAIKLWGYGFSRLTREEDGLLVWSWIEQRDVAVSGALDEDVSGLVEQIARSKGFRVALLFVQYPGAVKVSCRTSASAPSVDAAAVMSGFGGGGHVRAAGALIPGDLADVRARVLDAARAALGSARAVPEANPHRPPAELPERSEAREARG